MDLPVERWYPAIKKRHSRRRFNGEPLQRKDYESLQKTISEFKPFEDVRAVLVAETPADVFRGLVGSYGSVSGATAYMAFIGDDGSPTVDVNIGYLGEGLILEATALGLSTCWIGGFFDPAAAARQAGIRQGEKVFAVTPVGYAADKKTFTEKMMSKVVKSHQRKALTKIISGNLEKAPNWLRTAIEAASLAPSAINRQPWVFDVNDFRNIKLAVDNAKDTGNITRRLDCGIAMLHFQLGALEAGVAGHWEYMSSPQVGRFVVD